MGIIWSDINLNHSTILQSDGNALEFAYLCTKLFSWMLCMPWFFAVVVLQAVFLLLIQTPTNIKKNCMNSHQCVFPTCEGMWKSGIFSYDNQKNSSVIFSKRLLWLFWMWHECILFIYLHTATLWLYIRTLFELVICRLETKWFSES